MAIRNEFGYSTAVVEIGAWNMNSSVGGDATITVATGLSAASASSLRVISAVIIIDAPSTRIWDLRSINTATGLQNGSVQYVDLESVALTLVATVGGNFDSTSFDSIAQNRGYVTFEYIPVGI